MKMLRFLKRFFVSDTAPGAGKSAPSDQRGFDRYAVSFPVIVSGRDTKGADNQEKTVLHDISGSGAMFVSRFPEKYYPGQVLKISIMLDGTNEVRARIRTEATVIRINQNQEDHRGTDAPSIGIAVQFDRSFEFERIDNHDYRANG
ncbi:MAG: PilZ domain-containing protein [Thermodesulfobacteriota bacterium]